MSNRRTCHTATLLPNGKVLITGGNNDGSGDVLVAELYDPGTGTFTPTGSMNMQRECHTATLLPSGKVLIAGGTSASTPIGLDAVAELYDPKTGAFTLTGAMNTPRQHHTATLLSNGKVLLAGGDNFSGFGTNSAELYDPSTGTFAATGSMNLARTHHTATLLPDGTVLMAGGFLLGSQAEIYHPSTGTFASTGSMKIARQGQTATLLSNGTVLIAGGLGAFNSFAGIFSVSSVEEYHEAGAFVAAPTMFFARSYHTATPLPNGEVLMTGGNFSGGAELFTTQGTPCVSGTAGCGWRDGDLITFGQSYYGYTPLLTMSGFNYIYPGSLMLVGGRAPVLRRGFIMEFDGISAVLIYLNSFPYGPPGALTANLLDPSSTGSEGAFGPDVVELKLNIDFSDAGVLLGNSGIPFGDLTLCNLTNVPGLNGVQVRSFLGTANWLLAGLSTSYSIADIDAIAASLNGSFSDGYASAFARQHLVHGACP